MGLQRDLHLWWRFPRSQDATKTDMAHAGVDHLRLACRGAVTQAVVGSAQVRTTLHDSAGNANLRLPWIVALLLRSDTWVDRRPATCLTDFVGMVVDIPVRGPLPHIPRHVE